MKKIPLTKSQKEIMEEFYKIEPTKVIFDKKMRGKLWNLAKKRKDIPESYDLKNVCPALLYEIEQSYRTGNNIQPAIFSECVYAQTLANMFELFVFENCRINNSHIPKPVLELLESYSLVPRYSYSNHDQKRMLIQAGGSGGIDSALITVFDLEIYTIEFKEQSAKTSEPDLPRYGEDGKLISDEDFQLKYPQFESMLSQYIGTNIFDYLGRNLNDFTYESINQAISENYLSSNKYAHVCCTEDVDGYLVMLPINQIQLWARVEGEIRPAGRNDYKVWTPKALEKSIEKLGGTIRDGIVSLPIKKLDVRRQRGGNGKISGYKISPIFFVRVQYCNKKDSKIEFKLKNVRQLKPTIAAKVFFEKLKYNNVKKHYKLD